MKDITPILRSLGLLDSEIKTYISALTHGPGTVIDLSKKTHLSRQATYVAIESLTDRGLMTSVIRGKKRYYQSEHPEKLVDYAKRREAEVSEQVKELKRSLPELELQVGGDRPVVKLYEGKDGVQAILMEARSSHPKKVFEMTDLDAMNQVLRPEDLAPLKKTLDKIGTETKGIYFGELKSVRQKAKVVQVTSKGSSPNGSVAVTDDKIILVTFKGKMYSVLIESRSLANMLRYLLEHTYESIKRGQT